MMTTTFKLQKKVFKAHLEHQRPVNSAGTSLYREMGLVATGKGNGLMNQGSNLTGGWNLVVETEEAPAREQKAFQNLEI